MVTPNDPALRRARNGRRRPAPPVKACARAHEGAAWAGQASPGREAGDGPLRGGRQWRGNGEAMARQLRPCRRRGTGLHLTPFPVPPSASLPPHPVPPIPSSYPSLDIRHKVCGSCSIGCYLGGGRLVLGRRHIWHLFPCLLKRPALHPIWSSVVDLHLDAGVVSLAVAHRVAVLGANPLDPAVIRPVGALPCTYRLNHAEQ